MFVAAPRSALIISRKASTWWAPALEAAFAGSHQSLSGFGGLAGWPRPAPAAPAPLSAGAARGLRRRTAARRRGIYSFGCSLSAGTLTVISRVLRLDEIGQVEHPGKPIAASTIRTTRKRTRVGMAVPMAVVSDQRSGRQTCLPPRPARRFIPPPTSSPGHRRRPLVSDSRSLTSGHWNRALVTDSWSTKTKSAVTGEALETRVSRLLDGRAVVMVGMMGAGKSSVGRRLAAPSRPALRRRRQRDRAGRERHHQRDLRPPRRGLFPRRRAPRHPAPPRRRPEGAGDRRRRLHPAGDARRHPAERASRSGSRPTAT